MGVESQYEPARGPEKWLCIIILAFLGIVGGYVIVSGIGNASFYGTGLLVTGIAVGRLKGWLPGWSGGPGGGPAGGGGAGG